MECAHCWIPLLGNIQSGPECGRSSRSTAAPLLQVRERKPHLWRFVTIKLLASCPACSSRDLQLLLTHIQMHYRCFPSAELTGWLMGGGSVQEIAMNQKMVVFRDHCYCVEGRGPQKTQDEEPLHRNNRKRQKSLLKGLNGQVWFSPGQCWGLWNKFSIIPV